MPHRPFPQTARREPSTTREQRRRLTALPSDPRLPGLHRAADGASLASKPGASRAGRLRGRADVANREAPFPENLAWAERCSVPRQAEKSDRRAGHGGHPDPRNGGFPDSPPPRDRSLIECWTDSGGGGVWTFCYSGRQRVKSGNPVRARLVRADPVLLRKNPRQAITQGG